MRRPTTRCGGSSRTTRPCGGRVRVVAGDITREDLGRGLTRVSKGDITEVYHLAAVYDLGRGRDLATLVNVGGTRNLLGFA